MSSFNEHLQRIELMDSLIKRKTTGNSAEFAKRIGISRSRLFDYLEELKGRFNAPIEYDKKKRSYIYKEDGHIQIAFKIKK